MMKWDGVSETNSEKWIIAASNRPSKYPKTEHAQKISINLMLNGKSVFHKIDETKSIYHQTKKKNNRMIASNVMERIEQIK